MPTKWPLHICLLTVVLMFSACINDPQQRLDDCRRVGVLIPYTGSACSSGSGIERSLMLAEEHINAAGGVGGQDVCLLFRDTHSDVATGMLAARELVDEYQVEALIGPHSDDLAIEMVPFIKLSGVLTITGGTASPSISTSDDGNLWFRTAPTALDLGESLAQRAYQDGIRRASILYIADEYGTGFASVLNIAFTRLGGQIALLQSFESRQDSYQTVLQRLFRDDIEAVFLVGHPTSAATIIQEWSTSGFGKKWYFGPLLHSQVFLDNIPPHSIEDMIGISPAVANDAETFKQVFSERWDNEEPIYNAYFYYDALMLWALAAEAAFTAQGTWPTAALVSTYLSGPENISSTPGEQQHWNTLRQAFEAVRRGEQIDYQGASGPIEFNQQGDIGHSASTFWTVSDNQIVSH